MYYNLYLLKIHFQRQYLITENVAISILQDYPLFFRVKNEFAPSLLWILPPYMIHILNYFTIIEPDQTLS
jgi:hypothetical protein